MEDRAEIKNIDVLGIMKLLPHRYPFLLVDRITSLVPRVSVTGIKNVTMNEQFFQGHFPVQPVMPGVLILEGMAQAGGCMAYHSFPETIGSKLLYFAGIDKARFRRPVVPGDQLVYKLELTKHKRSVMVMEGKAFVDDQLAAEAVLMASFG
ncbi:MAG: 3-hydroxyacyl-ACP dehydratase FabZ [Desulfocapsaceae bacterium]|jgi:3-hydroxyacyl-[acyl-carrier-protein] dehydratase|nr:3-hydroxyacyl-ACP dehydratase FabZ [Desulfocapsaceae bacterium]